VQLGRLATLHLLDGRQYRSPEACAQPPKLGGVRAGDDCLERLDYRRTVLGLQQEQWLEQGLQQEAARWTLLAQGTVVAHMDQDPSERREYWTDGWTGYPAARQRLVETLQRTRAPNPVMLSGDIHAYIVAGLNAVPEDPDTPLVAGEFVTTSISSDPVAASVLEEWRAANPRFHRLDGSRRGYTLLDLSEQRLRADLVAVDDRDRPDSGRRAAGSYVMEAGHPAIHPA
jgi:alkaline phosphatase D